MHSADNEEEMHLPDFDSKWQALSAIEAIAVAHARGVSTEQAKADLLRALQEPARMVEGKLTGFGLLFFGAKVTGREWRAAPEVNWEKSTLRAVAIPPTGLPTPCRMQVVFKIPRESVDWLWPPPSEAEPAPRALSARPAGRAKSYPNDRAVALEGLAMVRDGLVPNRHQAAQQLASNAGGTSENAAVRRLLREMSKTDKESD